MESNAFTLSLALSPSLSMCYLFKFSIQLFVCIVRLSGYIATMHCTCLMCTLCGIEGCDFVFLVFVIVLDGLDLIGSIGTFTFVATLFENAFRDL